MLKDRCSGLWTSVIGGFQSEREYGAGAAALEERLEGKKLWIGGCGGEIAAKETDHMDCVCYQDLWQMEFAGIKGGHLLGGSFGGFDGRMAVTRAGAAVCSSRGWHREGAGAPVNPRIVES